MVDHSDESGGGGYMLPILAIASVAATWFAHREEAFVLTRGDVRTAASDAPGEPRLSRDPLALLTSATRLTPGTAKAPVALLVAVPAGPAPEQLEFRLNARFALHAAMTACGYEPLDASQSWFVEAGSPVTVAEADTPPRTAAIVPAVQKEGDIGATDSPGPASPATPGSPTPMRLVAERFRLPQDKTEFPVLWVDENVLAGQNGTVAIKAIAATVAERSILVGPSSTQAFESLAPALLRDLTVFSPWVTGVPGASTQPFICTDAELATTLTTELAVRDVTAPQVLLILERDSPYARNWAGHLRKAWRAERGPQAPLEAWYSRGIDGGDGGDAQPAAGDAAAAFAAIEEPRGESTLDYLRRLRQHFRDRAGERTVRAIGIFGQDIHDKLLILQALRPAFPDAVFFTSDLHAYYMHPSQLAHTRNLLVASGHDLLPQPGDEHSGPSSHLHPDEGVLTPFRDCYQTSAYLAFHSAICGHGVDHPPAGLLFEIGTHGAVPLTGNGSAPGWSWAVTGWTAFALLLVLATGAVVHWFGSGGHLVHRGRHYNTAHRGWFAGMALVAALTLAVLVGNRWSMEPAVWFDGISVWPTEVVRLLALTLSLVFAYQVVWSLRRAGAMFDGAVPGPAPLAAMLLRPRPWTLLGMRRWFRNRPRSPWARVNRLCGSALLLAVLLFGFGTLVMAFLGFPNTPVRGGLAWWIDRVITMASVFAMLWLVFLVVELARQYCAACRLQRRNVPRPDEAEDLVERWRAQRDFLSDLATAGGAGIYGPFVVILLMILSRWRGFDAWNWPVGLLVVIGLSIAILLAAHIALHVTATRLRDDCADQLKATVERTPARDQRRQLRVVLRDLEGLQDGVFAGVTRHPVMKAAVIPFTGLGGLSLLHLLG